MPTLGNLTANMDHEFQEVHDPSLGKACGNGMGLSSFSFWSCSVFLFVQLHAVVVYNPKISVYYSTSGQTLNTTAN